MDTEVTPGLGRGVRIPRAVGGCGHREALYSDVALDLSPAGKSLFDSEQPDG